MLKKLIRNIKKPVRTTEIEIYQDIPTAGECLEKLEKTIDERQREYYKEEAQLISQYEKKFIEQINERIKDGKESCEIIFKKESYEFGLDVTQKRVIYDCMIKKFREKGFDCTLNTVDRTGGYDKITKYDFANRKCEKYISVNLNWKNKVKEFRDLDIMDEMHKMMRHSLSYRNMGNLRNYYENRFNEIYGGKDDRL